MNVAPGASFEVAVKTTTGLAGTLGVRVIDGAGNTTTARVTTGIVEYPAGSGIYTATLTAPTTAGQYSILFDDGSGVFLDPVDLVVTYSSAVSVPTGTEYVTVADLKSALALTGQTFADNELAAAATAASRAFDNATYRRYYADDDANQIRYYTPESFDRLVIDDLVTLTAVDVDRARSGSFTESWTVNTDVIAAPYNAASDSRPYTSLEPRVGLLLPAGVRRSVRVTGKFGWPSVPADVYAAVLIIATKTVRRMREAPFGIVTLGADAGAMRIARTDPDVAPVVAAYTRARPFL